MLCSWYYIMVMELSGMQFGLKCEQALLFGRAKQASQERASEGTLCPSRLCAWFLVVLRKKKLGTLGTVDSMNLTKLKNPLACKIFDTTFSLILTYNSAEHITGVCLPHQICRYTLPVQPVHSVQPIQPVQRKRIVWHPLYFIH